MLEERVLERALRLAIRSGRCLLGFKEVIEGLKGSKLVVYSGSLTSDREEKLIDACKAASVPAYKYEGISSRLGGLARRPHSITVLAIRSQGEADLTPILDEIIKKAKG